MVLVSIWIIFSKVYIFHFSIYLMIYKGKSYKSRKSHKSHKSRPTNPIPQIRGMGFTELGFAQLWSWLAKKVAWIFGISILGQPMDNQYVNLYLRKTEGPVSALVLFTSCSRTRPRLSGRHFIWQIESSRSAAMFEDIIFALVDFVSNICRNHIISSKLSIHFIEWRKM